MRRIPAHDQTTAPHKIIPQLPEDRAPLAGEESHPAALLASLSRDMRGAGTIAPLSDPLSPPSGVPRASASGSFDVSSDPEPDPARLPEFEGDSTSLEQHLDAGLPAHHLAEPEPPRVEVQIRHAAVERTSIRPHSHSPDRTPEQPTKLDDGPVVRTIRPAEESGPWQGRPAAASDGVQETDEHTIVPLPEPRVRAKPRRTSKPSYAVIAVGIVAAAGLFAMLTLRSTDPPGEVAADPNPVSTGEVVPPEGPVTGDAIPDLLASAEAAVQRGNGDAALRVVDRILQTHPNHAPALLLRSSILTEESKLDDALAAAKASVRSRPDFADGHLTLGVIHQERGEPELATAAYSRYLQLAPEGLYARSIRRQLGRLKPAP